jgi:hypothetical protein
MVHALYIFTTGTQGHNHTLYRFQSHELRMYKREFPFLILKAAPSVPHLAVRGSRFNVFNPLARRDLSPVSTTTGTIARPVMSGLHG